MSPSTPPILAISEALISLYDGTSSLHGEIIGPPVPGSPYADELSVSPRKMSLSTATSKSLLLIESGGEHVNGFVRTLAAPMLPIACWSCIRSMLEPCARAAWLLDPAIDGEERIRRTYAVWYDGMAQQLKSANAMNQPKREREKIEKRIAKLECRAKALGFAELRSRKGKRTGVGVRMPTATDLIKKVLDAEGAYRILSAVSHGQAAKMFEVSTAPVSGMGSRVRMGEVSGTLRMKVPDPARVAWLGRVAARAFAKPLWYEFGYLGWERNRLANLFETTFDRLRANEESRFWR